MRLVVQKARDTLTEIYATQETADTELAIVTTCLRATTPAEMGRNGLGSASPEAEPLSSVSMTLLAEQATRTFEESYIAYSEDMYCNFAAPVVSRRQHVAVHKSYA
ncbi:hypothetical protein MRX96_031426 [Rhipicephalus microplus]